MKRVVITGLGPITPVGIEKDKFWNSLLEGKSGIDLITGFDTENHDVKIAGEVKDFEPTNYIDKKESRRMDRFSQFAVAATQLAFEDGNINLDDLNKERVGTIIGSGVGGMDTLENEVTKYNDRGASRVSPVFIPMMIANMAAGQISIRFGLKGSSINMTTACASATHAIGEAYRMIKHGYLDMAVTGGTEATVTPVAIAGFTNMKALSSRNDDPAKASRPFDKERDGFIMGEGAGILIVEELEHAINRGATIYAEVVGYGSSSDAFHITQPDPEAKGATRAITEALEDGNVDYKEVGYVNAHGTSTYFNDKLETLAIKNVFKDHAYDLNISATKSMTGHLLGAAGGIEAIATALALKEGKIPPTINYENPDEECDLNYTPNKMVERDIEYAISNSLGFGGHNGTIVLKKY